MPQTPTLLFNAHCQLGENPLWHPETGRFYWTDIEGGAIHWLHLESAQHEVAYQGLPVGGFTLQENGELLLFRVDDIAVLRKDGSVLSVRKFDDVGTKRFNDVIADPEGRVYAGTSGTTDVSGGLFLLERDLSLTCLFRGTGISNGLGFSPDLRTLYWTCSTRKKLFAFDYARETGVLARERVIYEAAEAEGVPDGLTVDAHGDLWSARWDGSMLVRHSPSGGREEGIRFPVGQVSSACFGGPALDRLLVTSAGGRADSDGLEGAVFSFTPAVGGIPEFRSRINY